MHIFLPSLILLSVAAAEFIPNGSFGRPLATGPYNNCSGTFTSRPSDPAIDTLPNISPDNPDGWEIWDLSMHQPGLFVSMRWIQGDPASSKSVPAVGTFELDAKFSNRPSYTTRVSGHKLIFTNDSGYSISIAGNTLSWDDTRSWFNTTLDVHGLTATFGSQSIMLDKFSPYAGWVVGQLTEDLFSGIPMTRGNSRDGSIVFPWGESIPLNAQSVLHHMFSVKPIQTIATNYAIRVFHSYGTTFGDTFIYESSRAPNGSRYDAFFLGRAETRGSSFEPYTIYAGTNSPLLCVDAINATTTNVQLAGCNITNSIPFSWNYTSSDILPAVENVDSERGKRRYHVVAATASEPYGDAVYRQMATGLVQTYEALGATMLEGTTGPGGEQPPNPNAVSRSPSCVLPSLLDL